MGNLKQWDFENDAVKCAKPDGTTELRPLNEVEKQQVREEIKEMQAEGTYDPSQRAWINTTTGDFVDPPKR